MSPFLNGLYLRCPVALNTFALLFVQISDVLWPFEDISKNKPHLCKSTIFSFNSPKSKDVLSLKVDL